MSEMIERVARAMVANLNPDPDRPGSFRWNFGEGMTNMSGEAKARFLSMARAAIEAMREPSCNMLVAVAPMPEHWEGTPAQLAACSGDQLSAKSMWQDMIDAALAEQPE